MDIEILDKYKSILDIQVKKVDILLNCIYECTKYCEAKEDLELAKILKKNMDILAEFY